MAGQRKFRASEKRLFLVSAIAVAFLFGFTAWRQWVDAVPDVIIPTPKLPSPNAYDFYVKAGVAIVPANPPVDPVHDPYVVPKSQWKVRYPTAKKEAWLSRNATALNLLRQGFQYPCRVPPQRSFASPTFHGKFRGIARMLLTQSRARSEGGNWKGAAESSLDILKFGHDITQGGTLLDYLVSVSVNDMGRSQLWKTLPHLNNAESKFALQRLENILQTRVSYADVLREEKYYGQASLLELMRTPEWRTLFWSEQAGLNRLHEFWQTALAPRRVVFNNYPTFMDALITLAQKPYAVKVLAPRVPNDIYNKNIVSVFKDNRWIYAREETCGSLLLVSLALRSYHSQYNRYPKTLAELAPGYLKQVPFDPYGGGELLRYTLTGGKYLLYSIGPDGVDNRGRPIEDRTIAEGEGNRFKVVPGSKGDIVAGINE